MLTFDSGPHEYRWNGQRVPNVTSILEVLHNFDMVHPDVLAAAQERGHDVHLLCQLFDEDDLDEASIATHLAGYLEGWKRFMRDYDANWMRIEVSLYHETMRFAGTPDREGGITPPMKPRIDDALIDIKTAQDEHPVWGLQLAAYNLAAGKNGRRRFTVQLRKDGTYRVREWSDPTDLPTFISLLTVRRWIKDHNV